MHKPKIARSLTTRNVSEKRLVPCKYINDNFQFPFIAKGSCYILQIPTTIETILSHYF